MIFGYSQKRIKYLHVFIFCLQMLLEVGFIAGQHELLSESLHKENYKNVREQVKKLREVRRRNMDEHKKHLTELKQVYHAMEKSKEKFRKAFEDQVRSKILLMPYYQSFSTDCGKVVFIYIFITRKELLLPTTRLTLMER